MNKRELLYRQMRNHGLIMVNHFKLSIDPVDLYRRLRSIENQAQGVMLQFNNHEIDPLQLEWYIDNKLIPKLKQIFGEHTDKVYFSSIISRHCLKLTKEESLKVNGFKVDGCFILAPDFKKEV